MLWALSNRADPLVVPLADRHYNRQKIGSPQFAPPGRCLVLKRPDAFWITSWPFAQYVKHRWAGAWVCSAFRNEGQLLSSELIRQACAATRWYYGEPPELGMVSFVDPSKVRAKQNPGYCFLKAGFVADGTTEGGLLAFVLAKDAFPNEAKPVGATNRHKDYNMAKKQTQAIQTVATDAGVVVPAMTLAFDKPAIEAQLTQVMRETQELDTFEITTPEVAAIVLADLQEKLRIKDATTAIRDKFCQPIRKVANDLASQLFNPTIKAFEAYEDKAKLKLGAFELAQAAERQALLASAGEAAKANDVAGMTTALQQANTIALAKPAGASFTFTWRVKRLQPQLMLGWSEGVEQYWSPDMSKIEAEAERQGTHGEEPPVIPGVVFTREADVAVRRN